MFETSNKSYALMTSFSPSYIYKECLDIKLINNLCASCPQAHMLGLLSSPSQPLPSVGEGHDLHPDLRSKLSKHRQLLVINVTNRDQLTSYFDVHCFAYLAVTVLITMFFPAVIWWS